MRRSPHRTTGRAPALLARALTASAAMAAAVPLATLPTAVTSALLSTPARAAADSLRVSHLVERDLVVAEVSAPDLLDRSLRDRIKSGLTNRLVVDAHLEPEGFGRPLFTVRRTIEIVFDLWDEHYLVKLEGAGPTQQARVATLDEVASLLRRPIRVELGAAAACERGRRYRADVTLTVNPVSEQVLERSREMMTSTPGEREGSSARSLLGSVARLFFNVSVEHGVRVLRGLSAYAPVKPAAGAP
ncbi:MAG: hypothetical protein JXR83_06350 [Deltaproteobacteria bacterium]|nr:hypothetical protein [Deltaproteobacteria bacterium]